MNKLNASETNSMLADDFMSLLDENNGTIIVTVDGKGVGACVDNVHPTIKLKDDMNFSKWARGNKKTMPTPFRVMFGKGRAINKKVGFYYTKM